MPEAALVLGRSDVSAWTGLDENRIPLPKQALAIASANAGCISEKRWLIMNQAKKEADLLGLATNKTFVIAMGIVFLCTYIFMNTAVMNYFLAHSNGNAYVEMNIFYASELSDILQSYGNAGRECYVKMSILFDFIFPLQYSLFMASCSISVLKRNIGIKMQNVILALGGILCLSDWMENVFIIAAIKFFPNLGAFPYLAQFMTLLKSGLTIFFALAISCGVFAMLARGLKGLRNDIAT